MFNDLRFDKISFAEYENEKRVDVVKGKSLFLDCKMLSGSVSKCIRLRQQKIIASDVLKRRTEYFCRLSTSCQNELILLWLIELIRNILN